ncbi:MAG: tryptophan--tRNA ligase [Chloroflexi bacterium]|nr:tryptophan--tRNA ligase [Chloroflexota bacterium]GIW10247.1 MAG: tryptophan--tRNA ligase [Dehalococcoidia bacterium]
MTRKRLLTGDRPTGKGHLGHYVGSWENRVALQDEYECFFLIADLHTLTTAAEQARQVSENVRELVLDWLAVGIDPERSTIYLQSLVPEVTELFWLFACLVSVPRAQRIPTLKDVMRDLAIEEPSVGLLSYPILQAADVLMVRAEVVPVGKDQESHLELLREIARRFNRLYGEVFPESQALIGRVPTLVGTDGQAKMSKSLNNAIFLSDPPEVVEQKVRGMYTDPKRIRSTDPGTVEGNPVFIYHRAFNENREEVAELEERYRTGRVGDVEVKQRLAAALNRFLDPIRERRARYAAQPGLVDEIILSGTARARAEAQATLRLAREAVGLPYQVS